MIARVDLLLKDTDLYLFEMFAEMRKQIDLKYEEYKLRLDEEAQKMITELNRLENEYKLKMKSSVGVNKLETAKETARSDLNQLKVDENKWRDIQFRCNEQLECLQAEISDLNEFLLNDCNLNVEFTVKLGIDQIFQRTPKMDSNIITNAKMVRDLIKLCEINSDKKFSLLYRASRDGFGAKDFHSKCDDIPKTLTIIKSTTECIFGGYTDVSWTPTYNNYKKDPNAYLFSLINKQNEPLKIKVSKNHEDYVIGCHGGIGPRFGSLNYESCDLIIYNNSNVNMDSFSNLGISYQCPKFEKGSKKANTYLAGLTDFKQAEIEVFQIL